MTVLCGYADPWTVRPGATVTFHVSSPAETYRAGLVRLIHGDTNPHGPGLKVEEIEAPFAGEHRGQVQPLHTGSYVRIDNTERLDACASFTILTHIWPTLATADQRQGVLAWGSTNGRLGISLGLTGDGTLEATVYQPDGEVITLAATTALPLRQWQFVAIGIDRLGGRLTLFTAPDYPTPSDRGSYKFARFAADARDGCASSSLIIGADAPLPQSDGVRPSTVFNGKIEGPTILNVLLSEEECQHYRAAGALAFSEHIVARLHFGVEVGSRVAVDISPNELHGEVVNRPTRAVASHEWTGECADPKQLPDHYNAIHFHEDDLEDARWQASFSFKIPDRFRSGVYAARLVTDEAERFVTFFVAPAKGETTASTAVLLPSLTYLAYQNKASVNKIMVGALSPRCNPLLQEADYAYLTENKLASTYNTHADGSERVHGTTRAPNLTSMNPVHRYPLFDGPHCLGADLHLIDWLESKDIPYDVITDHLLHNEGSDLLSHYRVVLTGTHPEYYTREMINAVAQYQTDGGRLMYLGGNGFFFVTAVGGEGDTIMETRRDYGDWTLEPGETHMALNGELGGLWRQRGKTPQQLVGVGFTAQGFDRGSPYQRTDDSYSEAVQFVFEGIDTEVIGDFPSLVLGYGAAGFEVDRADPRLGTPPHVHVLATSTSLSENYWRAVDEVRMTSPNDCGTRSPFVRSDMVFFAGPNNGAVFSVGSISWCAALSYNGYDNNVSRTTENVLRAFASDKEFNQSPKDE